MLEKWNEKKKKGHAKYKPDSGCQGWGNRESLFNGYGVSVLQDEKSSGDGWWWWLHNVNVVNATELCT